ncbi:serine/threonine protein phosphatase [Paenibacillus albiflavus]|uniref:Serine/threonine protein phosphatase n=1 Tax=Paenibacillus albiflavus TaxID=2545760 RepID=A0A4R4ELI4_9BACL|nr:metallophosphoesterase family protein [Paenibacillus albiflavus]TCZ81126.1 serine/threonine protein phosphatase [Paenibacillus albiflavus]
MKRTLVISDIHGCYQEFNQLLSKVNYNSKEDQLVLLGDYTDRGPKSKEVLEQVMLLVETLGVLALRGNHDQMLVDAVCNGQDSRFLRNGGMTTLESFCGWEWFAGNYSFDRYVEAKEYVAEHYSEHLDFLNGLPYYYEDDKHIYVHAGIDPTCEDWKQTALKDFLWIREPFFKNPTGLSKKVVFGHTPTIYLQETADIFFDEDKIAIDGGCCFGNQLNCLEITKDAYYTHYVPSNLK